MNATLDGLKLFVINVFPSLFPFFIITKLLTLLGLGKLLSKAFDKPISKMYKTSSIGGYILILSMMSGYPIGAKMVAEYYNSGEISLSEAKKIITFSSTSGPLFILGTIGTFFLKDYSAGLIILISHVLSSVLNGLIYRGLTSSVNDAHIYFLEEDNVFTNAIQSTILSTLQVGACIVFLNVLVTFFYDVQLINIIAKLFSLLGFENDLVEGCVVGVIEITKGVSVLSSCPIRNIIVPLTTLVSFGGVSVMLQSMSFLKPIGITFRYYLTTKISQAMLGYLISSILVILLY